MIEGLSIALHGLKTCGSMEFDKQNDITWFSLILT